MLVKELGVDGGFGLDQPGESGFGRKYVFPLSKERKSLQDKVLQRMSFETGFSRYWRRPSSIRLQIAF